MYVCPKNMSQEESEFRAVEHAKLQILADTFGTLVGSITSTTITTNNGQSSTSTHEIGESEVKGEWISTIGEPVIRKDIVNGEIVLYVKIKGVVRELTNGQTEFEVVTLKNGVGAKYADNVYKEGDDFFLSFKSPVDGYLSVYLFDGNSTACLLPYMHQSNGIVEVKGGKNYIFFNKKETDRSIPAHLVDEIEMFTDRAVEYDRLYVIFSPNQYYKANDAIVRDDLPRQLDYRSFQSWLLKLRKRDTNMTVKLLDIEIHK